MDMDEIAKRLETAEQELAVFKADYSDKEKAYMDGMDDEEKKAFMGMPMDQRLKAMDKGKIKKSDTIEKQLDDVQKALAEKDEINKALSDQVTKQGEAIAKMQAENELLKLEKRAEKELAGIAGTSEQKAKLLKSIEGIEDEEVRKMALENLKAKSDTNHAFMKELGASGNGDGDASSKLEAMAKKLAADEKITVPQAFAKVLSTPEGADLYKQSKVKG